MTTVSIALSLVGCSGGDPAVCVPGATAACPGANRCAGTQICNEEGSGFGSCFCAAPPEETFDGGISDAGIADDAGTLDSGVSGFPRPAGSTPVSFCVDDRINQTYGADDGLAWQGSFSYDSRTRVLVPDYSWQGPYPELYDDGPYDLGGHEPLDAVADDHVWCVTAFLPTPEDSLTLEYGARSDSGWIWMGSNGSLTIPANWTEEVIAAPLVLPAHGTTDIQITVDANALAEGWQVAPGERVRVQETFMLGQELEAFDDGSHGDGTAGDGVFTMRLSAHVGPGNRLPNNGLAVPGIPYTFRILIGFRGYDREVVGAVALQDGVRALVRPEGGNWSPAEITSDPQGDLQIRP